MRVAAGGRGVEVGRAPDAAVDVLAALISTGANSHGTVHDACTASATRRVGRARAAEHHAAAVAAIDRGHAQAAVEARAGALDPVAQVG